jgi:hypothetical protein
MTSARPPLSFVRHLILPEILTTILIACSPRPLWLTAGLILSTYTSFSGLFCTTGQPFYDYYIGTSIMTQLLAGIALTWLTDPMREKHRENETIPTEGLPLLQRIYWAIGVKYNPRGIGWNYTVSWISVSISTSSPPSPPHLLMKVIL